MKLIIVNPPLFSPPGKNGDPRTAALHFRLAVEEIAIKVGHKLSHVTSVKMFHHRGASTVAVAQAIGNKLGKKQVPVNILERPFYGLKEIRTYVEELVASSDTAVVIEPSIPSDELLPGAVVLFSNGEKVEMLVNVDEE